MRILHSEASRGWGGQEIRILRESLGMIKRGHQVLIACPRESELFERASSHGIPVFDVPFREWRMSTCVREVAKVLRKERVELLNTHSSSDAWLAGFAARICRVPVLRTRHVSTRVRSGPNCLTLFRLLADAVVTTCEETAVRLRKQTYRDSQLCRSVPTGIELDSMAIDREQVEALRRHYGIVPSDTVVGTLCVMRAWKGLETLLRSAKQLSNVPQLKWLIVGDGEEREHLEALAKQLGLGSNVIFTGYLSPPYNALAAMDIFTLLSEDSEGVSQASLQAAYLGKPMITTRVGGLPEVCREGQTGVLVDTQAPDQVAAAVMKLLEEAGLRKCYGEMARDLVRAQFSMERTLDEMEAVYGMVC